MPRHPDQQYLKTRKKLKRLWFNAQRTYSYLTPNEQWQLHDFYRPSEDLTDAQLITHRSQITQQRPVLPHQAARALVKLDAAAASWAVKAIQPRILEPAGRRHRIQSEDLVVRSIVRPKPDIKKLSRAILLLAEQLQAEQAGLSPSASASQRSSGEAGSPDAADEPALS